MRNSSNVASHLWTWFASLLGISFDCTSIIIVYQSCKDSWTEHVRHLAFAAITHVFHSIWMARNDIQYNNARIYVQAAKTKVLTALAMSAKLVEGYTYSAELPLLHNLRLQPKLRNAPVISLVLWKEPMVHLLNVNTDRSVIGTPPSAARGEEFFAIIWHLSEVVLG
ncbi:RNA-directed DNA polymerase (Reverse transcriptase) [Trifolium medium]|uniref:RNA-directed DNA polymerase (Reverse transcriptase) n=1 Tax=Trifolium medium TaxID=97028 RepID=A0A392Q9R9_9FABA|nr:RNA-directed DNA polymerase (Reverse transcriptase) [Trifolium medium]